MRMIASMSCGPANLIEGLSLIRVAHRRFEIRNYAICLAWLESNKNNGLIYQKPRMLCGIPNELEVAAG